jgi:hypothetical protein
MQAERGGKDRQVGVLGRVWLKVCTGRKGTLIGRLLPVAGTLRAAALTPAGRQRLSPDCTDHPFALQTTH